MTRQRTYIPFEDIHSSCCIVGMAKSYYYSRGKLSIEGEFHVVFYDGSESLTAPRLTQLPTDGWADDAVMRFAELAKEKPCGVEVTINPEGTYFRLVTL